ncbi:MAG: acyl--CoA ligase [Xanthobacteraceae bacterium]|nr:acyl--CoA ligase [Xanthobacteraceae bacterium]
MESDRTAGSDRVDRISSGNVVGQTAEAGAVTGEDHQRSESPGTAASPAASSPTLCDLFARTLARRPDALALSDPPNKARVTGQPPLKLTYAQADRAIASLTTQLMNAGLPPGSVVAMQMANTIEYPLVLLAAWRAGLTVALLPQLWRRAELADALGRVSARAIICASRIEIVDHAELAMSAAADTFSIRQVFGIGGNLPDGMTPLDLHASNLTGSTPPQPPSVDARKAAIVSFDVMPESLLAVPRSHVNLIAGGLGITMESALPQGARILSCAIPSSFAGLVTSIVAWLLTGGSLSLHHPFDLQTLEKQIRDDGCNALIVPAHLALRLSGTGAIDARPALRHVIGLWRTPECAGSSNDWLGRQAAFTDVYLFGEAGLFAAQRLENGSAAPIAESLYKAARSPVEIHLTPHGTLALRGAMTVPAAYRAPRADDDLNPAANYVDTGYAARRDKISGAIYITAPPAGLMTVGGYRYRTQDLERWAARLAPGATLTALPDQLNGHRLAGRAEDNARAREALAELGLGPLMTEAFRERGPAR